jgi:NitT/TauT family transport system ATP-binding protein
MMFREFRKLRCKSDRLGGFPDLLNYAALIDPGVILLKDGSLLAGWRYSGPDLNSASPEEMAALVHQVNGGLARLGDGWMMNVDLIRRPSVGYPEAHDFPDPVTALIDHERRLHYTAEGQHFESLFALTLTWTPPTEMQSRAVGLLFQGRTATDWEETLDLFRRSLTEHEDALSARLLMQRMDDIALLSHLNSCITGRHDPVRPPAQGSYLDVLLGNHEFHAGFQPMLDDVRIRPIGLTGLPLHSWPEVIAFLDELAIPYRWSTRFIFLDPAEAERALRFQRLNWFQKRHGLAGMIKQVFSNGAAQSFENKDALAMAEDADDALAEASSNRVRFGYYTSTIIVMDENRLAAESNAREIAKQLHHHGFPAVIEHVNANEAYLGSLPGHGYRNVRRPLIHTRNLADLMPTTNIWPGEEINPCPFYPENSPPLCHAATTGGTPFRLNLHVDDVGHTLIFGPTGSGKSTLLRTVGGLISPTSGSVLFRNQPMAGPPEGISIVFQSFALFPWLTVIENVEIALDAIAVPREDARRKASAAIDLIGLDGFQNAYPRELSGGMRQRVGFSRAIAIEPVLLLMDEPFSALDVLTAELLRTDLVEMWQEGKLPIKSILLVTHNIEEAVFLCDRIIVLAANPGRIAAEIAVPLPQPRERLAPVFREIVDDIYARMTAGHGIPVGGKDKVALAGLGMRLPVVSSHRIAGLLEMLADPPFDGTADLRVLARRLRLELDRLLPAIEAAQILRFAEMRDSTLHLTTAGKIFAQDSPDNQKRLFAEHLLRDVPLAAHIRHVLLERPGHMAPRKRFSPELEDHLAKHEAEQTLTAVIDWGRYAEIFTYDQKHHNFSLPPPSPAAPAGRA